MLTGYLNLYQPYISPSSSSKGRDAKAARDPRGLPGFAKKKNISSPPGVRNQVPGFVKRNKRYFLLQVLTKVIKAKNRFLMKAKEKKERNQRDAEGILSKRNVSFQI